MHRKLYLSQLSMHLTAEEQLARFLRSIRNARSWKSCGPISFAADAQEKFATNIEDEPVRVEASPVYIVSRTSTLWQPQRPLLYAYYSFSLNFLRLLHFNFYLNFPPVSLSFFSSPFIRAKLMHAKGMTCLYKDGVFWRSGEAAAQGLRFLTIWTTPTGWMRIVDTLLNFDRRSSNPCNSSSCMYGFRIIEF